MAKRLPDYDPTLSDQQRYYRRNKALVQNKAKQRQIVKREALAALKLKHGCTDCGYNKHPSALDFDHLTNKSFVISKACSSLPLSKLMIEVEKCEVVCANCHRIRTASRL